MINSYIRKFRLRTLTQAALMLMIGNLHFSQIAFAQSVLNIYTTREPELIQPLLNEFEKINNVKVNTLFLKNGLVERLKSESEKSQADVLLLADAAGLQQLSDEGLTQAIPKSIIDGVVDANLHELNYQWTALSLRARVIYVAKDLKDAPKDYADLADAKWRGKVCIRAGQHPYNLGLISAMIAHDGEDKTRAWLSALKSNLARKAGGGDRDVARDILGGICDVGIANSYYVGIMKSSPPDSENYRWGEAIRVVLPNFNKHGTHVNVSGAAIAKYAPNAKLAQKLIEYLLSENAQAIYAKANYEYPVRKGVKADALTESFGVLKADSLPLEKWVKEKKRASVLVDEVGFDK